MSREKPYVKLLEESFPGIRNTLAHCEALGFLWDDFGGRVFVKDQVGIIVSHVALIQRPVLIDKQWHTMAALHAVCTKNDYQGQGLASELIAEALQWAKNNSDFQILFTEIPAFYERLGFTFIHEHRFTFKQSFPKGSKPFSALATPKDDDLFLRCFKEREPLSESFWVEDRGEIASFTTLFGTYPSYWSLYYCPGFDGFLSWFFQAKTLHLLDIVAAKLPSLEQIIEYLPQEIDEIFFYFPPERLNISAKAEAHVYDKGHLMVHGSLPSKDFFMIAPLSRC